MIPAKCPAIGVAIGVEPWIGNVIESFLNVCEIVVASLLMADFAKRKGLHITSKAPDGPNRWSRGLNRSKMKLIT